MSVDQSMASQVDVEESGIHKHIRFWDKKNKGYITPIDAIYGFISLGYNVFFSVALGTVAGVFLSFLSQTSWLPDPFCRSSVSNLVRFKKQTSGAYDQNGAFNPEKFEELYHKYATSDDYITFTQFIKMTSEQEKLGFSVRSWVVGFIELCTAYFFIGDHGSLAKEDVRAAYDGTLFYRLKDNSTVQRKQKTVRPSRPLAGSYLLSSRKRVMRFIKDRLRSLSSTIYAANPAMRDWMSYLQENTMSIKNSSISHILKRSSGPMIQGVAAPKPEAIFGNKKNVIVEEEEKQDDTLSHLTGVAQPEPSLEEHASLLGDFCVDGFTIGNDDTTLFHNMTKSEEIDIYVIDNSDEGLMNGFLRTDSEADWLQEGFTGVKKDDELVEIVSEKMHDFTDDENKKHATESQEEGQQQQQEDHAESSVEHVTIAERELVVEHIEEHEKITITPPPDEVSAKKDVPITTVATQEKKNPEPVQGKKNKKKKKKNNQTGHVSPITSDSGKD